MLSLLARALAGPRRSIFSATLPTARMALASDLVVNVWRAPTCLPPVRSKHSATQMKRLFQQHPARKRVEKRLGIERTPEPVPPPTFSPVFKPEILPNGWSKPPSEPIPEYPFKVSRTKNKPNDAIGFLPVYAKHRKDGTKTITRIKKVTGDRDLFLSELRSVLELPMPNNPRSDAIRIRVGGTIEVEGNRVREVRSWLAGLGF